MNVGGPNSPPIMPNQTSTKFPSPHWLKQTLKTPQRLSQQHFLHVNQANSPCHTRKCQTNPGHPNREVQTTLTGRMKHLPREENRHRQRPMNIKTNHQHSRRSQLLKRLLVGNQPCLHPAINKTMLLRRRRVTALFRQKVPLRPFRHRQEMHAPPHRPGWPSLLPGSVSHSSRLLQPKKPYQYAHAPILRPKTLRAIRARHPLKGEQTPLRAGKPPSQSLLADQSLPADQPPGDQYQERSSARAQ